MAHVFISYVRDDQKRVDALVAALRAVGIEVWIDKSSIKPGERWQKAIRDAITSGTFFIACFSRASHARMKSYMSEELTIALDDLRMRPANRTWFIPVRLEDVEIPDLPINRRESITDLQWVDLHQDWERGIGLLIDAIQPEIPVSVVLDAVSQDRFALDALLKESFADQLQQSHTVVPVLGMHACTTVAEAVRLAARKTIQVTGRPLDVTDALRS